jgi:acyl-CoA thioesterase I
MLRDTHAVVAGVLVTQPRPSTDAERRHFLRYTRTQRWPMLQRFPVTDELHVALLAQMLACPPDSIQRLLGSLHDEVRSAAAKMLADDQHRAAISALPFRPGDRIVAVGDSITADRLGWFELLAASVDMIGFSDVHLENLGVSGNTTADVLERFDLLAASRPTHVLLMLGTNDAREHGLAHFHRMASNREAERNLRTLTDLITGDLKAAVTLITPPTIDPARVAVFFADSPVRWQATGISDVAATIRKTDPSCVDLHTATEEHGALDDFLESDGVHPTPAGQAFILGQIVEHLVAGLPCSRPSMR